MGKKEFVWPKETIIEDLRSDHTVPAVEEFLGKYRTVYIRFNHLDIGVADFSLYGIIEGNICNVMEIHQRQNREMYTYSFQHELKSIFKPDPINDPWNMMRRLFKVAK